METRAVLDTNVILAAQISISPDSPNREIVDRWRAGEFTLLVTEDIVAEYIEKLQVLGKSPGEIVRFISRLLLLSELVEIRFFHMRHYPDDADDVAFLLCAVNGEASHLVSYDPHILGLRVFYDDFSICRPLEFLADLRSSRP